MQSTSDNRPGSPWRATVIAGAFPIGLAGVLVGATWLLEGALEASHALLDLIYPVGLTWLLSLGGSVQAWLLRRRREACVFAAAFIILFLGCNGVIAGVLMRNLLWDPQAVLEPPDRPLRCVVVLGGGVSRNELGIIEVNEHGQRAIQAAQLWHAGKAKAIVCAGESMLPENDPAEITAELLRSLAVPAAAIYRVGGPNTKGEMRALRAFFDRPPDTLPTGDSIGLITSAFHMRRAMRLADSQSLEFVPLPCVYPSKSRPLGPRNLIPTAAAGATFSSALKEYLAVLVGR